MHARTILVVAAVWLSSLVASNVGAFPQSTDQSIAQPIPAAAPQGKAKPPAFKHNDHVIAGWAQSDVAEVFRDCRGCHRFGPEARISAPQDHCASCHYGTGALDTVFEGKSQKRLEDFASRTRSSFQHHTHGMLECRECHHLDEGRRRIPGSLPLSTGPGECARCHEASQARQAAGSLRWFLPVTKDAELAKAIGLPGTFTVPTDLDQYAKTLDEVFSAEGAGINVLLDAGGDFTHGDHLKIDCTSCHQGIEEAAANGVGAANIVAKGCGDCHKRSPTQDARFAPVKKQLRDSFALGAFAHADHFRKEQKDGVCSKQAYDAIADGSCAACHTYSPEREGFVGRDFPFDGESSKHRYQDCQECHDVVGWNTGETASDPSHPPLHGSTSPQNVSGWDGEQQSCTACHAFGEPDMAGNRPKQEVRRWADRTFVFSGQTHPYITEAAFGEAAVKKDCKDCHRAVVPSLPSRLIEKKFRHATHLPGGDLTQDNCKTCHKTAGKATSSAALAVDYRTYDVAYCTKCHLGGTIAEDLQPKAEPVARSVVAFPHGPHASKVDCMKCHDRGQQDMGTSAAALDCKQCHDHKKGDDGIDTEYLFGEQKTCGKCHTESGTDLVRVPAIRGSKAVGADARYGIEQAVFAGFRDTQFHPSRSDCATCHRARVQEVEVNGKTVERLEPIRTGIANFVFSRRKGDFHPRAGQNSKAELKERLGNREAGCMSCHWKEFNNSLEEHGIFPEAAQQRRDLGNQFRNFPGLKSKG